uniref:Uncharacterized protein n=1 Tax=Meloidogyne floridensis TaxID=298350 RepID=A0A915P807_9BILA
MLLFKHGRNRAAAFGMLWELLLLALIHQVAGESPPESPVPPVAAVPPSAANTVGFGRHTKSGNMVTVSGDWDAATSPEALKPYKDAALSSTGRMGKPNLMDACWICLRSTQHRSTSSLESRTATAWNIAWIRRRDIKPALGFGLLKVAVHIQSICITATQTRSLPFIYSRTVAEFQSMRNFQPATGDGCPGSCWGNVVCRKWTGLAAGFVDNGGKVARSVVGIGNPGGSGCYLATATAGNDASYKMTVDNGNMHWFATEGCAGSDEGGFPRDAQCVNKNSMAQELGEKITWEIEGNRPDSDFTQLFTFALLPTRATRVHSRQHNVLYGEVGGPKCDELYVKFPGSSFKLLVPKGGGAPVVETLPTLAPEPEITPPPPTEATEEGGGSMGIVFVIIAIVLIVAVVGGVLVFFFVIKKSEPDAVEEDYFGTSKAGGTTKTKAGTTVGATQAKTGGLTTVGTKAGTTAGGTAKTAAAATKAGTTVGGKTAGGKTAGGGTTKK